MVINMKKQRGTEYGLVAVLLLSLLLLWIWTGFEEEAFLIDDNRTQWYPVMEKAYEDVLEGKIYYYDFYQMKGMSIAEQGYYGIMNPFMLLSYCLTHYTPLRLSTITIYIMMLFLMGNSFFYLLCCRIGCDEKLSILMTLSYSTAGCFVSFYCWYYVYNNYFIIPLLLYIFLIFGEHRIGYFACGIVLAVDLYLGNAQYACYHYMLFCILCMGMIALKKLRYFGVMCVNVFTGIILSIPLLALLLETAGDFGKNEEFFDCPIYLFSFLIHSVVPHGILHRLNCTFTFLGVTVMDRSDNLVLYLGAPCLVLGIILVVMIYGRVRKYRREAREAHFKAKDEIQYIVRGVYDLYEAAVDMGFAKQIMLGCIVAMLCFLSFMGEGFVALVLNRMPVIRNFRYLFKAIFIITPLINVLSAFAIAQSKGKLKKVVVVLTVLSVCAGICNAYYTVQEVEDLFDMRIDGSFDEERTYAVKMLEEQNVDYKNYRTAAFLKYAGVNDECFDISNNLTRNFATGIGAFSLAGYEIATPVERLKEFDAIYLGSEFFTVFADADTMKHLYFSLQEQPKRIQNQLIDNGVRYLLVERSDSEQNLMVMNRGEQAVIQDYEEDIIEAIKNMSEINVERVSRLNQNYDLIELSGVNSLCMNARKERVPLSDENMQTLSFEAEEPGIYYLAFSYDSHLKAYLEKRDGTKEKLAVEDAGNGTIAIDTNNISGKVVVTYEDVLCHMGFLWEIVVSILFVGICIVCIRQNRKQTLG